MNKQIANFGRKLSAADMKKMLGGGGGVGTGGTGSSLRCRYPLPPEPCITSYSFGSGRCCACCRDASGDACRSQAAQDPFCWTV